MLEIAPNPVRTSPRGGTTSEPGHRTLLGIGAALSVGRAQGTREPPESPTARRGGAVSDLTSQAPPASDKMTTRYSQRTQLESEPTMSEYDIVVLGGGSGGYATALRAAQLGLSVVLIEKDKLGGTCLHRGCIPTKALLHAGEVADQTRESEQFGVKAELVGIDMAGVNAYKDGVVARLYKGLQGLLKQDKITVVPGEGKLVAQDTVEVDGQRY